MTSKSPFDSAVAPRAACEAANSNATLFDVSDRVQIEVTGSDRQRFLHNFCTNDVNGLSPAQGCEAFFCNQKARVLGHGFIFAGKDAVWLDMPNAGTSGLLAHLGKFALVSDVTLTDCSADYAELCATGPEAAAVLNSLGLDVAELLEFAHLSAEVAVNGSAGSIWCRRVDWLGGPGFLIGCRRHADAANPDDTLDLATLAGGLVSAGCTPGDSTAFDVLRIEAGTPLYGRDVTEENLAPEANREAAIGYAKGCYLGQEPIARIKSLGHVNRSLVRLRIDGPPPASGSPVAVRDGADVGVVTSSAGVDTGSPAVALAYIRREHTSPGSQLRVGDATALVF